MDRQDFLDRLDFHNDFILDQQVKPVSVVELELAVVNDRYQLFGRDMKIGFSQLMDETYAVNALKKSWPQF